MAPIAHQYGVLFPAGTVHSDGTTNSRQIQNSYHKGVLITIDRTAETGTCTLDAQIEFYDPAGGDWYELEGASFVQFANSEVATRYLMVYPGIVGSDADNRIALDTNEGVLCGQFLPRIWRLKVTTGGTTVTNTFSASYVMLA